MFGKFCEVLGRKDLLQDSRFRSNNLRTENYQALHGEIERSLVGKSVAEWLTVLEKGGIPCGPINNIEQVVNDPHIRYRNMIISVEADNESGDKRSIQMPGTRSNFLDTMTPKPGKGAPRLDEHRQQILEIPARGMIRFGNSFRPGFFRLTQADQPEPGRQSDRSYFLFPERMTRHSVERGAAPQMSIGFAVDQHRTVLIQIDIGRYGVSPDGLCSISMPKF